MKNQWKPILPSRRPRLEPLEARDVPSFLPPLNYPVPSTQYGTVVVDIDSDGKADVIVAAYSLDAVAVFKGDGTGLLDAPVFHAIGHEPVELRVLDLNNDGKLDVVTTNDVDSSNPTIGVLLGNGDGTFQPPSLIPMAAGNRHFAAGDFNRDGRLDLATSNGPQNVVNLWFGNGDGTFQAPHAFPNGPGAWGIQAADLNGDGRLDLVTVNPSAGKINILLNRGDGTFKAPTAYVAGNDPVALFLGDLNSDGLPDVVVTDFSGNTVNILFTKPDGTVKARIGLRSGPIPFYPRLGDFNGDGRVDIATPQYGNSTVAIFLGNGNGTFTPHTEYGVAETDIRTMAVGDLNNDGFTDVIVPTGFGSGGYLNVLRNDAHWTAPIPPPGPSGQDRSLNFPASSEAQLPTETRSLIPIEPSPLTATEQHSAQPEFFLSHRPATIDTWLGVLTPDRILGEADV